MHTNNELETNEQQKNINPCGFERVSQQVEIKFVDVSKFSLTVQGAPPVQPTTTTV
jgi:hypothetical protein